MNAAQPAFAAFAAIPQMSSDDAALVERVGWVLLNFLWQGAAVAALLAGVLILLRRRSAASRYGACCAALLLMAAAPPVTFWSLGGFDRNPAHDDRALAGGSSGAAAEALPPGALRFIPTAPGAVTPPAPPESAAPASVAAATTAAPRASFWISLVLAWAFGVAALSLWRLGGWIWLRRLLRRTEPVGPHWERTLADLAGRLGVARPVRLARAAWVQVPSVVGVLRPVVLLPAAALTGLSPGQLEALLAHELAHVRRLDYLVNLAQSVLETVLFYHPAVWWVSARVREEREHCCDDLAAGASGGGRVAYAEALAAMEALRLRDALPAHLALAARGAGGDGALLRRVRRLLGREDSGAAASRARAGLRFRSVAAALVAVGCLLIPLAAAQLARADKDDGDGAPNPAAAAEKHDSAAPPPADVAAAPGDKSDGKTGAEGDAKADDKSRFDGVEVRDPDEEDLVADVSDYRISPNDLLSVTINDLQGPNVATVVQKRVTATGNISLPYLGEISAGGQTEAQFEKAIVVAYREARLIQQANVSVEITEARGRSFSILGAAGQPGQYAVLDNDFRLLEALAMGKTDVASGGVTEIHVIRKQPPPADPGAAKADAAKAGAAKGDGDKADAAGEADAKAVAPKKPRVIRIPVARLLAGDPKVNVVIRPGDMIVLKAAERPAAAAATATADVVHVVVAPDGLTLRGGKTTWDAVSAELGKTPPAARARTALVITPGSEDLTLRQWNEAQRRAGELVKQHAMRDLLVLPSAPAPAGGGDGANPGARP
jgi:beta-lactamase regulating signal transducer with metallopeptidase domain